MQCFQSTNTTKYINGMFGDDCTNQKGAWDEERAFLNHITFTDNYGEKRKNTSDASSAKKQQASPPTYGETDRPKVAWHDFFRMQQSIEYHTAYTSFQHCMPPQNDDDVQT